jgi:hypothetical protein
MKKQLPTDELRKKLFDIEVALYMSQEDMEEVSVKITILNKLQKDLVYNVNLHKSGTVTTSLNEYKSTLKDLKKTREEIKRILNLQQRLEGAIEKLITEHDYYNFQYEQVSAFEENNKILQMNQNSRKVVKIDEYEKRKRKDNKRKD